MRSVFFVRVVSYANGLGLSFALTLGLVGCEPTKPAVDTGIIVPASEHPDAESTGESDSSTTSPAETSGEVTVTTADRAKFDETIAGLKGKVILVDYWATWCTPCVEQFPHTVAKANELADRNFAAVSVSLDDPGDPEPILVTLRSLKADKVTNLVSAHGAAPESYEVFALKGGPPWYQLYDREGELKYVFCDAPEAGVEALPVDQIDAKIEELLGQPQE